jgi:hypothetical protein
MAARMASPSPLCASLLLYHGACTSATTNDAVRARSTAARSRRSHLYCALPGAKSVY